MTQNLAAIGTTTPVMSKPTSVKRRIKGKGLIPFAIIAIAWYIVARLNVFPSAFFAGPTEVASRAWTMIIEGILTDYLFTSVLRLVEGAAWGLTVGIAAGYAIGLNRHIRRFFWPLLLFFQAVADIAWLPLVILWFGFSPTSVNLIVVYSVIFPVIVGIVAGIDGLPENLLRAARTLGASRRQIFFEVIVPGSFASAASGIRTGLGFGWRALIAAEIIVGTSGIGFMMFDARRAGHVTEIFLGMLILGALWYAIDAVLLAPLEKATVERWGIVGRIEN
ncbi:MAG: ABC transporter permease [Rhizobiaceae bacterium]|nr:ABC transporter permease [Rhizobiaceae bacterium]